MKKKMSEVGIMGPLPSRSFPIGLIGQYTVYGLYTALCGKLIGAQPSDLAHFRSSHQWGSHHPEPPPIITYVFDVSETSYISFRTDILLQIFAQELKRNCVEHTLTFFFLGQPVPLLSFSSSCNGIQKYTKLWQTYLADIEILQLHEDIYSTAQKL